jgi:hypothetical protein
LLSFNGQATMTDWCKRASAVFDIHSSEDIYRRAMEDENFRRWLELTELPFYTPYPYPGMKNNVIYPLQDVTVSLLGHFLRGDQPNPYFTSGPCYAIALAIFQGYERIEIYGIEMENNTEYIYQRDGIGLWCGIAAGMGIDVVWPDKALMFYAPLYGYSMEAVKVDKEAFEAKASELQLLMEETKGKYDRARGILDALQDEFVRAKLDGKSEEEQAVIAKKYEDAQNSYEQTIANHAFINGQYVDCRSWQARLEKTLEYNGQAQAILAQRDEKWVRMADKIELAGRELPNE